MWNERKERRSLSRRKLWSCVLNVDRFDKIKPDGHLQIENFQQACNAKTMVQILGNVIW